MTYHDVLKYAKAQAISRSMTYDVVQLWPSLRYSAYPRFYDNKPRSDKGGVVTTFDSNGRRLIKSEANE